MTNQDAPGAPGITPRWTSSAKEGIGTAYHTSSRVWFTVSHGIINEIYHPHLDTPNTRDLQLLVSDGETFFHEEKRDLQHRLERPEPEAPVYKIVSSDPDGRYEITKTIICEPHSSAVLISVDVKVSDKSLRGKLKVFALLAPHLSNSGQNNSAELRDFAGRPYIAAERNGIHLMFGCNRGFIRRSAGYVGASDGWTDLHDNFTMDWQYARAKDGNIAVIGDPKIERMIRISQQALLSSEDKTYLGATIASMSIPWGETKDDSDQGGYHLVWARDMLHTVSALIACGEKELPLRSLTWLACVQDEDGLMPQNSRLDGTPYWKGGSAMPLCWSHAELLSLIRSHQDGVVHGRIAPVYRRYAKNATENKTEVWTFAHQLISVAAGKPLRIIVEAATRVRWTYDDWKSAQEIETETLPIGLHFVDLPIAKLEGGAKVSFTFHGKNSGEWEKENFSIVVR